jgi:hypothetical protein
VIWRLLSSFATFIQVADLDEQDLQIAPRYYSTIVILDNKELNMLTRIVTFLICNILVCLSIVGCSNREREKVQMNSGSGLQNLDSRIPFKDKKAYTKKDIPKLVEMMVTETSDDRRIDLSPSTYELIFLDIDVIPHVLPIMRHNNPIVRMRAHNVLMGVTQIWFGFKFGQGWKSDKEQSEWIEFLNKCGELDPENDATKMATEIKLWETWYLEQIKKTRG